MNAQPDARDHGATARPALAGLRVLDISTLLPGPLASLMLAAAGAEVTKIERPGSGDEMRGYTPRWGCDSALFALLNRGKQSLAIDLNLPGTLERLQTLPDASRRPDRTVPPGSDGASGPGL